MKLVYRLLFIIHLFVGIGAVAGGLAAITNPNEPLGIGVEMLKNSPFNNYLIPGILLFTVIGLGNIFSAIMCRFNMKYQGYLSSVFSWALVIWIVVQCIMLYTVAFLHVLFFIIGLIQAILSILILFDQHLFPSEIVISMVKNAQRHGIRCSKN